MRRSEFLLAALCALSAIAMGETRKSPQNLISSNPLQGMAPAGVEHASPPPAAVSVAGGQETRSGIGRVVRSGTVMGPTSSAANGDRNWAPNAKPDNGGQTADGNAAGANPGADGASARHIPFHNKSTPSVNPGANGTSARHIPFHNKSTPSAKREASGGPGGQVPSTPVLQRGVEVPKGAPYPIHNQFQQTGGGELSSPPIKGKENAKNPALQHTREGNVQPAPGSSGNAPVQQTPEGGGRPASRPLGASPQGAEDVSNQTHETDKEKNPPADPANKPGPAARVANVARTQVAENAQAHDVRAVIACWDPGDEAVANALAKQLTPAIDAIASGAKLTKADAARVSKSGDDVMIGRVAEVLERQQARGERKVIVISVTPTGTAPATTAGAKQNAEKCEPPCWTVTNELGPFCMCLLDFDSPTMEFGDIPDPGPISLNLPDHLKGSLKGGSTGSTGGRLSSSGGAAATPHLKGETEDETTGRRMHRDWIVFVVNGKNLPSAELGKLVQQSVQAEIKNPSSQRVTIKVKSCPR